MQACMLPSVLAHPSTWLHNWCSHTLQHGTVHHEDDAYFQLKPVVGSLPHGCIAVQPAQGRVAPQQSNQISWSCSALDALPREDDSQGPMSAGLNGPPCQQGVSGEHMQGKQGHRHRQPPGATACTSPASCDNPQSRHKQILGGRA